MGLKKILIGIKEKLEELLVVYEETLDLKEKATHLSNIKALNSLVKAVLRVAESNCDKGRLNRGGSCRNNAIALLFLADQEGRHIPFVIPENPKEKYASSISELNTLKNKLDSLSLSSSEPVYPALMSIAKKMLDKNSESLGLINKDCSELQLLPLCDTEKLDALVGEYYFLDTLIKGFKEFLEMRCSKEIWKDFAELVQYEVDFFRSLRFYSSDINEYLEPYVKEYKIDLQKEIKKEFPQNLSVVLHMYIEQFPDKVKIDSLKEFLVGIGGRSYANEVDRIVDSKNNLKKQMEVFIKKQIQLSQSQSSPALSRSRSAPTMFSSGNS